MTYAVAVVVSLKPAVNDPQGLVVRDGLRQLGFSTVRSVRIGKHIEVVVEAEGETAAVRQAEAMCERLLCNQVIEDARVAEISRVEG